MMSPCATELSRSPLAWHSAGLWHVKSPGVLSYLYAHILNFPARFEKVHCLSHWINIKDASPQFCK